MIVWNSPSCWDWCFGVIDILPGQDNSSSVSSQSCLCKFCVFHAPLLIKNSFPPFKQCYFMRWPKDFFGCSSFVRLAVGMVCICLQTNKRWGSTAGWSVCNCCLNKKIGINCPQWKTLRIMASSSPGVRREQKTSSVVTSYVWKKVILILYAF